MLIEPNSTIELFPNVPLNNSYEDTYYFENKSNQDTFFNQIANKITLKEQTYQRHSANSINVSVDIKTIINYNYLRFRNKSYEDKWFYAFIIDVEYVSNNNTRVYYEIDVIQTWFDDYKPLPCYIERQHSKTDGIGDNIVPENFTVTDYVVVDDEYPFESNLSEVEYYILVSYKGLGSHVADADEQLEKGGFYCYTYQGLVYWFIPVTDSGIAGLRSALSALDFLASDIVSIQTVPARVAETYIGKDGEIVSGTINFTISRPQRLQSYLPKNNKLLTYPYVCSCLVGSGGESVNHAFEYFDEKDKATYSAVMPIGPGSNIFAYPTNYCGHEWGVNYGLSGSTYPQGAYGSDNIYESVLNTSVAIASFCISSLGQAFGETKYKQALDENPVLENGFRDVSPELYDKYNEYYKTNRKIAREKYIRSEMNKGDVGKNIVNTINKCVNPPMGGSVNGSTPGSCSTFIGPKIYCVTKTIRKHQAEAIDSYFTMYGYAYNKIGVPNFHARPGWTYIKTLNYNGYSEDYVPNEFTKKINEIHNAGIRYWDVSYTFGDFRQTNK